MIEMSIIHSSLLPRSVVRLCRTNNNIRRRQEVIGHIILAAIKKHMAKLLTSHEDAAIGHFHALIGVINLLVYTWRLNVLGGGDMDCGFGQELRLDLMSLILMVLPNLSAFLCQACTC